MVRIQCTVNLRIPTAGSSAWGESGPKLRPKGVGDGQSVDIPIPGLNRLSSGVTQEDMLAGLMDVPV